MPWPESTLSGNPNVFGSLFPPTLPTSGNWGLSAAPGTGTLAGGTGAGGSKGIGGGDAWKSGLAKGLPLLLSLLAPKGGPGIDPTVQRIQQMVQEAMTQGGSLVGTGEGALQTVIPYLRSLVSGDPGALAAATQPERTRVIDQYDTVRGAAARTQPGRSGGAASANVASYIKEASDLSSLLAGARSSAAEQLGALGGAATSAGLSAEAQATSALAQTLGPLLQQQQGDRDSIFGAFASIGEMLGPLILAML